MVKTRETNKNSRPGLVDLDKQSVQRPPKSSGGKSNLLKEAAIDQIEELEERLAIEQHARSTNAREPPGPGVNRQPHGQLLTTGSPADDELDIQIDRTYHFKSAELRLTDRQLMQ